MKKYFFALIFVFSVFFLGLSTNEVSAAGDMVVEISQASQYDNHIINFTFSNYHINTASIRVSELKICTSSDPSNEEGCGKYPKAVNNDVNMSDYYFKVVGDPVDYKVDVPEGENVLPPITKEYTVRTMEDGAVYLLITCHQLSGTAISGSDASAFIIYTLSTLNQRVVINPNSQGIPTNMENNIQYTAVRNNNIKVSLSEEEYNYSTSRTYNGDVYVCEYYQDKNNDCLKYTLSLTDTYFNYYFKSYGDGEKVLRIYLIKEGKALNEFEFTDLNSTLVVKNIILDTIGPKIKIDGGQWIYVPYGSRYEEQKATCSDAVFSGDECTVKNDLKVVRIDYTKDKYQLVTYEATDRLGNTSSLVVKVKVEIPTEDTGNLVTLLISGLVLVTTFTILGIVVYKNHLKKKKLSYI